MLSSAHRRLRRTDETRMKLKERGKNALDDVVEFSVTPEDRHVMRMVGLQLLHSLSVNCSIPASCSFR